MERLRAPVVGACGHSFCQPCTQPLHVCPVCRTPVPEWRPNYALREQESPEPLPAPIQRPLSACPLERLEHSLSVFSGYERIAWRGFTPRELWCILMLVRPVPRDVIKPALPKSLAHTVAVQCKRLEVTLPQELSPRLFAFKIGNEQHVLWSMERVDFDGETERRWKNEPRAQRRRCEARGGQNFT